MLWPGLTAKPLCIRRHPKFGHRGLDGRWAFPSPPIPHAHAPVAANTRIERVRKNDGLTPTFPARLRSHTDLLHGQRERSAPGVKAPTRADQATRPATSTLQLRLHL